MNSLIAALADVLPGKLTPIALEVGWGPQPIWTLG